MTVHLETDRDYRHRLIHDLTGHEDCARLAMGDQNGSELDEIGKTHGKPRYGTGASETYDEQKRWYPGGAKFKVAFRGQLFEVTADQLVFEDDVLIDIRPPFRAENVTAALEGQLKAAPRPERARRYLPTLSDLVDRMVIVQLKALFIPERRAEYLTERELIEHDVDLILAEGDATGERVTAADVHAIIAIALTNHMIWINESRARAGGNEQDKLLKLTHSLNGQRNLAKNKLARMDKGRHDHKADCFAAELVEEFGHLQIF